MSLLRIAELEGQLARREARIAVLEAQVSQYRDLQPAAVRHSYDGFGWLYVDNGSGSSWLQVGLKYPHGEVLYSMPAQLAVQHLPADDTEGGAL